MSLPLSAGALCTPIVEVVFADTTLAEAARLMRDRHVGCLVVVEQDQPGRTVAGILTDRDIVVAAVAADRDTRKLTVGELMTRDVATAREEDSLAVVLEEMRVRGVRRMPVVGRHGVLVGLLAFDDLLAALALQVQAMTQAVIAGRQREGVAPA
jgi:CBS domain-containing protein